MGTTGEVRACGCRVDIVGRRRRIMSLYCFGDMILGGPNDPAPPVSGRFAVAGWGDLTAPRNTPRNTPPNAPRIDHPDAASGEASMNSRPTGRK